MASTVKAGTEFNQLLSGEDGSLFSVTSCLMPSWRAVSSTEQKAMAAGNGKELEEVQPYREEMEKELETTHGDVLAGPCWTSSSSRAAVTPRWRARCFT